MTARPSAAELAQTVLPNLERRVGESARFLLGLAGPPGAGKSDLADALVAVFERAHGAGTAIVVGMDGFHLRQRELVRRGLQSVKGSPQTFDPDGFIHLLAQLRQRDATVVAPRFDRTLEEPVAADVSVEPQHRLLIVEGNYLLFDGPWTPVRNLLDETWQLSLPDADRVPLLIGRHVAHGRTSEEAIEWVLRSDEANARLITAAAHRADAILDLLTGHLRRNDNSP